MLQEIALIGFAQSIFFSTIISLKKNKTTKDYLLSVYFIFLSFELLYRYLIANDSSPQLYWFILLDIIYWALFGPLLVLYINALIVPEFKFNKIHLLHLVPLLISLFGISGYLISPDSYKSAYHYFDEITGLRNIALWIWEFCSAVYLIWAIFLLVIHKLKIKDYYSNTSRKDFNWLLFLVIGFALYIYSSYVFWIMSEFFSISSTFKFVNILSIILTVYVFILGLFGYKQDGVFFDKSILIIDSAHIQESKLDSKRKYQKTRLSEKELKNIAFRLDVLMIEEKPFLDSELTLNDLAEKLKTSLHKLSQTINLHYKKNFFEYINSYRISEFKSKIEIPENQNIKIECLAYDCGFNSKSAFYAIFKRSENLTPSQYKNKLL